MCIRKYSGFVALCLVLAACQGTPLPMEPDENVPVDYGYPYDDTLRIQHIQAKGTHNSYHLQPQSPVDDSHKYTQPSLTEQLGQYGIRQLELDLHYDNALGFQVHHIPVIDDRTSCPLFVDCLQEIKDWSDTNPGHHVLFVWIEIKDAHATDWDAFDDAVRSVWPQERLLTPDDVQADYPSLRAALSDRGWPTLGETRDRIVFMMNNEGTFAERYSNGFTSLAGRVMFVRTETFDHPLAAVAKHGSPARMAEAIAHNMLLGDNAGGAGTSDADAMYAAVATAESAGVHFISSDFPAPVTQHSFFLDFADGNPSRCNPKTAPDICTSAAIEDLPR